jgi:hypothetical protein
MSKIVDEVLSANDSYARDFGNKANLAIAPSSGFCNPDLYGRSH